jgi:hypothetical protein
VAVAFRDGLLAGRTLELAAGGATHVITAPPAAGTVPAGTAKLRGGKAHELALRVRRGTTFAENPQELAGVDVVLSAT